jgi:hypothetical protein
MYVFLKDCKIKPCSNFFTCSGVFLLFGCLVKNKNKLKRLFTEKKYLLILKIVPEAASNIYVPAFP